MDGFNGTVDFTKEEELKTMKDKLADGCDALERLEGGRIT